MWQRLFAVLALSSSVLARLGGKMAAETTIETTVAEDLNRRIKVQNREVFRVFSTPTLEPRM